MISVKVGEVYECTNKRCGVASRGDYMLFEVKAEKGSDRITIFANNPRDKGMKECSRVKVLNITEVTQTKRQYNDKWYPNYNVYAELEPIMAAEKKFDEFMAGPTEEDIDKLFGLS